MTSPIQFPIPPKAYLIALEHLSQRIGKPLELLTIMAYDLLLEQYYEQTPQPQQIVPPISNLPQLSKNTPICSSQLDVIPTGDTFGILMEQDDGYWLDNRPYSNLSKALNQIREYEKIDHTDLNNWISISGEYPLVILQKPGGLPHIWLGQNSACKIFNNKDVKSDSFKLTTNHPTQNICKSCVNNYKEIRSPRVHLIFDSKKRLLIPDIQSFDPLF